LQSFPISYQFFGGSLNARYRLAGDAVPPRLSFLIGQEIRKLEGRSKLKKPLLETTPIELSPPATLRPPRTKPSVFALTRKFGELVPGKEVRGCRVELDNLGTDKPIAAQLIKANHLLSWGARLYVGEGSKVLKTEVFSFDAALRQVAPHCAANVEIAEHFDAMLREAEKKLVGWVPDASTLQAIWSGRSINPVGPELVVDKLSALVNEHFPVERYSRYFIPRAVSSQIVPDRGLRVRLAAALVLTAYCAALINEDTRWAETNSESRFFLPEWPKRSARIGKKVHVSSPADQLAKLIRARSGAAVFSVRDASSAASFRRVATSRSA
jgi:hypothetical protein